MGDVLIKNMEMPDRCFACPLCDVIDSEVNCVISHGSYIEYREIDEQTAINGRPSDCPLVPVTPHGRLGDLDKISKVVLNWIATQEKAYPNEDSNALSWRLGARAMGRQIYRDIEAAPTIIEAEEGES